MGVYQYGRIGVKLSSLFGYVPSVSGLILTLSINSQEYTKSYVYHSLFAIFKVIQTHLTRLSTRFIFNRNSPKNSVFQSVCLQLGKAY